MAGAESIVTALDKEIVELKVALEERENKYYNMDFNNAENSTEPVMFKNRKYGFGERWMAAVAAIGLPKASPFRNPD